MRILQSVEISWPNSAPITPNKTTAVVCFRFSSAKLDGLRTISSSSSSKSSGYKKFLNFISPKLSPSTWKWLLTFGSCTCGVCVPEMLCCEALCGSCWTIGSVCVYRGKNCAQLSTSCLRPFLPIRPNSPNRICCAASRISIQWCCQRLAIISTCGRLKLCGSAINEIIFNWLML